MRLHVEHYIVQMSPIIFSQTFLGRGTANDIFRGKLVQLYLEETRSACSMQRALRASKFLNFRFEKLPPYLWRRLSNR